MNTDYLKSLLDDLNAKANDSYDGLCGVELTLEDAETVAKFMSEGKTKDEAMTEVLDEIQNVLDM